MNSSLDLALATAFMQARLPRSPSVSVVLGSGLGQLVDALDDSVSVSFDEVPGFVPCSVEGHLGQFVTGRLAGAEVLLQSGRYHSYEGYSAEVIAAPVRVAAALGVRSFVFTNAVGGIRENLVPGDLVLIDDHINATFQSCLPRSESCMSEMRFPYDPMLRSVAKELAVRMDIPLARGTYAAVLGPAYETAAEIRALEVIGADVVGMSTVLEVGIARALGIRCLAFSMVTNKATGLRTSKLSHNDVVEVGQQAGWRLTALLTELIPRLATEVSPRRQND
ncbi:MAG: purine-nucleoside phosphorylase [Gemmatimonadota bacterium]|nr:purine-nucleoside phosphorylase [Gemmatimonadota bacterium]